MPGARGWLILPLLWFGGYWIAAGLSHWQATQFVSSIEHANRGKQVAWDPRSNALVIDTTGGFDSEINPDDLINRYGMPSVFTKSVSRNDIYETVYSLVVMRCPQMEVQSDAFGSKTLYQRVSEPNSNKTGWSDRTLWADNLCLSRTSGRPDRPAVVVDRKNSVSSNIWLLSTTLQSIRVSVPGGAATTVVSGSAEPLSWLPQPILGCGLNSGAPSWDCFVGFGRSSGDYSRSPLAVVVAALGLPEAQLSRLYPDAGWRPSSY